MRCAVFVGMYVLIAASFTAHGSAQVKPTAPPQTTPAAPPQTKPAAPPQSKPAAPARLSITVLVTAMDGKPLPEIWVKASGPVDREGPTDASGTVLFNNVTPGSYRLRFEHEKFVTLEKDVHRRRRAAGQDDGFFECRATPTAAASGAGAQSGPAPIRGATPGPLRALVGRRADIPRRQLHRQGANQAIADGVHRQLDVDADPVARSPGRTYPRGGGRNDLRRSR